MKRFDQINVIPFIDIMLVLLAIVLTTASFIAQGKIPIDLPVAASTAPLESGESVEITIDAEGNVHFDGEMIHQHALDSRLDALTQNTEIVLRVDAATTFRHFVTVVDKLKARNLSQVAIVTRRET